MIQPSIIFKKKYTWDKVNAIEVESTRKINPELEAKVEKRWQEKFTEAIAEGRNVFDGNTYRVESLEPLENELNVKLSVIKFSRRDIFAREFPEELMSLGEEYYPKGGVVTCVIETSDRKFIYGERGNKGMTKRSHDLIGGVLSQDDGVINSGHDLYKAMLLELNDEVGIEEVDIKDSYIIAALWGERTHNVLVAYVHLNLSADEVYAKFNSGHDDEMKDLMVVDLDGFKKFLLESGGFRICIPEMLE